MELIKKIRTLLGLQVTAQAGDLADPSKLPKSTDEVKVVEQADELRMYPCGHEGPASFQLSLYGELWKEMHEEKECPTCWIQRIKKHVIRCALCGLPIFPGEGVAVYHKSSEGLRLKIATYVGKETVLGCMRWDCCPSGGFFGGRWTEQGFKSLFEGRTAAEQAYVKDTMVIGDVEEDKQE